MAVLLRAGALPATLEFLEERTIGPELGADSIEAGKLPVWWPLRRIDLYGAKLWVTWPFRQYRLNHQHRADFWIFCAIGATLTLPGIAGIVLTIGMAVDANVLIFERIREELKTAKGPARAIELGYERIERYFGCEYDFHHGGHSICDGVGPCARIFDNAGYWYFDICLYGDFCDPPIGDHVV